MLEDTALTPQEVADILKIAKNTVYELIKRGDLNGYKVGKKIRVDFRDIEAYINRAKSKNTCSANILENNIPLSLELPQLIPDELTSSNDFVICGQDALLDILACYLELPPFGIRTLRSYTGSYNGLMALYLGKIQVATAHLWDGDSDTYNIPFVRRLLPGIPTVIIHLACRMQGFYVAKGNPKNITGWEDLKRPDITMVNREKGCGTRVLLDEHLRLLNIDSSSIKGYDRECFTHLAVASTVARGGTDVAMGNEKTGLQIGNIDFVPLQRERYELVIKKKDMDKAPFKAIIKIIRSEAFRDELIGIGGYDLSETGDIIGEL